MDSNEPTSLLKPADMKLEEPLKIIVNGVEHTVNTKEVHPTTSLNKYLRDVLHLTGTKKMCFEGGCGACVVAASFTDPITQKPVLVAINSCLVPVYSCSGWKIYTIEKIGNEIEGYHPAQKALVQFSGTQCGYCSPGMIMNMYALYESSSSNVSMAQVENSFGGNMCRCTGYRPILTAFKSLASDASAELLGAYSDIEDIPVCKKGKNCCQVKCQSNQDSCQQMQLYSSKDQAKWYKAFSLKEVLKIIKESSDQKYMLIGGNTASGIYRQPGFQVYIDIKDVKELLGYSFNKDELVLGANMTITDTLALFRKVSQENNKFAHLKKMADHLDLVANVPVRNVGTLAGNLFTKHEHREFYSDIFLLLETAKATLTLVGTNNVEVSRTVLEFLSYNMKNTVIKNIRLPPFDERFKFESYKIMARSQNTSAIVNAGFLVELRNNEVYSARIVYGGISPNFVHATATESYLLSRNLFDDKVLQNTYKKLSEELKPAYSLPDAGVEFRKQLAISLFYKFVLSIAPSGLVSPRKISGGLKQTRPLSSGTQDFETNESLYPLTEPIPKVEALAQCIGTAEYIMDMPDRPNQLYGALVLAKAPANSTILGIDASKALEIKGVEAFFDKFDIPGDNNFTPSTGGWIYNFQEEIFCSGVVKHYYQPVGMVLATSQELALEAAELVDIQYQISTKKPLLTIREILENNATEKINEEAKYEATSRGTDVTHVLEGTFNISFQYHYHMETQCCVAIPIEDGLDVYPSTQDSVLTQGAISRVTNLPINKINLSIRRLGGAYGGKISRNSIVSCAAAMAAHKLKKPVKLSVPFSTNMNVFGKRHPLYSTYKVGLNDAGVIQYLDADMYCDMGSSGGNENPTHYIPPPLFQTYKIDTWNINFYTTLTDTPTSTWTRGPGTVEAISYLGGLMQHIATDLNLDVADVHLNNLDPSKQPLETYLKELISWADIEKRRAEVKEFNKNNRWVKRGLAILPMHFPTIPWGDWNALVSIHQGDGTVSVAHAGVEMGQGMNTKVAQATAYALKIPLDKVSIKPTTNLISPNPGFTGASITSEGVCYSAVKAAGILLERMQPVKESMGDPTWEELVRQCYIDHVDMTATYMFSQERPDVSDYSIYGATAVEVEIDVLTGQNMVKRVDIIEDVGSSVSPIIDIGQVEGAFVMGLGYWTSEEIAFDEQGKLVTNTTWTYKPPGIKDIPVDFRIKFPKENRNPLELLGSKAVAEPPLCMTVCVANAMRDAITAARIEADSSANKWLSIDGPTTVEYTFMKSLHDYVQYTLKD